MLRLGHPLTWVTICFISGGCRERVYAHTNGDGDFVLFDRLGWPWPIHECYLFRTAGDGTPLGTDDDWETVRPIQPNVERHRRVDIVGTLTNYDPIRLGGVKDFKNLPARAQERVRHQLGTAKSLITVVTGRGEEYIAFADMSSIVVSVGDTVGVRLKAIEILGTAVFLVSLIKRIIIGAQS